MVDLNVFGLYFNYKLSFRLTGQKITYDFFSYAKEYIKFYNLVNQFNRITEPNYLVNRLRLTERYGTVTVSEKREPKFRLTEHRLTEIPVNRPRPPRTGILLMALKDLLNLPHHKYI